jgi:alpha-D-ribose 1-methylphosphonate 5-triphosphate synthase subunit PhnH
MLSATYDEVYDAQTHYRELLDAMARPGKINQLQYVPLLPEGGLCLGSAYMALLLLGPEVTFSVMGYERAAAEYIRNHTNAKESHPEDANFIFATAALSALAIHCATPGNLLYPETSATLVIGVRSFSSGEGGELQLALSGPGIESETIVSIDGWDRSALESRAEKNAEYPLGIDLILVATSQADNQPAVLCLPRTTTVITERYSG